MITYRISRFENTITLSRVGKIVKMYDLEKNELHLIFTALGNLIGFSDKLFICLGKLGNEGLNDMYEIKGRLI